MSAPKFNVSSQAIFNHDIENMLNEVGIRYDRIDGLFNFTINSIDYFIEFEWFNSTNDCGLISNARNINAIASVSVCVALVGFKNGYYTYCSNVTELRKCIERMVM